MSSPANLALHQRQQHHQHQHHPQNGNTSTSFIDEKKEDDSASMFRSTTKRPEPPVVASHRSAAAATRGSGSPAAALKNNIYKKEPKQQWWWRCCCNISCSRRGGLEKFWWCLVTALIVLQTVSFLLRARQQQQHDPLLLSEDEPQQWSSLLHLSSSDSQTRRAGGIAANRKFPTQATLCESSIAASLFVDDTMQFARNNNNNEQRSITRFRHHLPPLPRLLGNPDYGGLEFHSLVLVPASAFQRTVRDDDSYYYHYEKKSLVKQMDKQARKDDQADPYDDVTFPRQCAPQKWAYEMVQNCNSIHQDFVLDRPTADGVLQFYNYKHLANGHYRDTFLFEPAIGDTTDIVVKEFRYVRDFTRYNTQNVNREALILEKLSGSDRITKIYGHCGNTVLIERGWDLSYQMVPRLPGSRLSRGRIAQEDLDELQTEDVHPMNNFTAQEKLDIALAFAEGVAEMHGYREGVIAHDDISIDQWMLSEQGKVIFTDFNNAVPMEWNYEKKRYCKFWASYPGTFKAPEVYAKGDHMVSEQVDIWPMGNLIFALLTGLKPYYEETEESTIQGMAIKGEHPYLDPRYRDRSYIEGRMIEIMEQCHKRKPSSRASIFEVVQHLRDTKKQHEKMKKQAAAKPKTAVRKRKQQQQQQQDDDE